MTQDEIVRMAWEASPDMTWYAATDDPTQVATEELEFLERFATIVATHEREACAKLVETTHAEGLQSIREACAAAIRSRSDK